MQMPDENHHSRWMEWEQEWVSEDEWSEWIIAGLRHLDLNQELVLKQTTFEGFLVPFLLILT